MAVHGNTYISQSKERAVKEQYDTCASMNIMQRGHQISIRHTQELEEYSEGHEGDADL